jgi:urease beta subunit
VSVHSRRFLYGARIDVPGFRSSDDAFSIEPGRGRELELVARDGAAHAPRGGLTALNLNGRAPIEVEAP